MPRYQALIKDVNAKIDRLRKLDASAVKDPDAWSNTFSELQRDVEDTDEVLGKITMETRRCVREKTKESPSPVAMLPLLRRSRLRMRTRGAHACREGDP